MSTIGHNNPPFDFFEFFDLVVATTASTAEKLVALIHARQIARRNGESYLSRSTTQAAASISDNTYQRAIPVVRLLLQDTPSRGRATTWKPRSDITAESVEEAIQAMRDAPKAPPKRMPQNGVYPKKDTPERGMGMPQNGRTPTPILGGHKDQSKDQSKDKTPPTPSHAEQPRGTKRDPFGLNRTMADIHQDVWFDADDRIQVANGFKAELEGLVGANRLRAELDRAAEWIGPNTPATVLKSKVRGRLQSQAAERRDKDERYQRATAQNAAGQQKSWADRRQESDSAWLHADLDNRQRKGRMRPVIETDE